MGRQHRIEPLDEIGHSPTKIAHLVVQQAKGQLISDLARRWRYREAIATNRHLDGFKRGSTVCESPVRFHVPFAEEPSRFRVQQFEIVPLCVRSEVDALHATSVSRTVLNSIFLSYGAPRISRFT